MYARKRARSALPRVPGKGKCDVDDEAIRHGLRKTSAKVKQSPIANGSSAGIVAQGSGMMPALFAALAFATFWKTAPACSEAVRSLVKIHYDQPSPPAPP